jgi:hypothetical protein
MSKIPIRIVALLLVSCLILDPAMTTAMTLRSASVLSQMACPSAAIEDQALTGALVSGYLSRRAFHQSPALVLLRLAEAMHSERRATLPPSDRELQLIPLTRTSPLVKKSV